MQLESDDEEEERGKKDDDDDGLASMEDRTMIKEHRPDNNQVWKFIIIIIHINYYLNKLCVK